MAKKIDTIPAEFIVPLNMNALHGRMLRVPPPAGKTREILFVYGHHSSLERWWGLIQGLADYGGVTAPDLPGFGGMDSLYKIGERPSMDTLADYLAAFVKMRYKRRRVTIVGLSFGFLVATRMLQRYPELAQKVDILISVVGFAHGDDFSFSPQRHRWYRIGSRVMSMPPVAIFCKYVLLHPLVLRTFYAKTHNAKVKFAGLSKDEHARMMKMEITLWHDNDFRTHMDTTYQMLTLDNCKKQIPLPVWHIASPADQYFDAHRVEQHMRVIFQDFTRVNAKMDSHAPSVVADKKTAASLIPRKIRQLLAKKPA